MSIDDPEHPHAAVAEVQAGLLRLIERIEAQVVGQRSLLERLVIALLAGGHVLIEGVPGLAKTRAVRALARALDLPFRRIQFTPDLLPADLTGTQIYRPATGTFDVRPGPIVTQRPAGRRDQSGPGQGTECPAGGHAGRADHRRRRDHHSARTFWVLATQNPIEHEGTYPLPEAQLDRFLMKLVVGYPTAEAELAMLELPSVSETTRAGSELANRRTPPMYGPDDVARFRALAASIQIAPTIKEYIVNLVRATREPAAYGLPLAPLLELGASPRATIALVRAARGHALLAGRDFVTPHDVKSLARDIMRHRILVSLRG